MIKAKTLDNFASARPQEMIALALMPLALVTLFECLFNPVLFGYLMHQSWGGFATRWIPAAFLAALVLVSVNASRAYGREGLLSSISGVALMSYVVAKCRGSLYWPGQVGYEFGNGMLFYIPITLGLCGAFIPMRSPVPARTIIPISFGVALLGSAWTSIDSGRDIGLYDLSPYTRHLAIGFLSVLSFVVSGFFWWSSKQDE